MAIIENIFGTKSNLSGTTWPDKWSQCLAIIAISFLFRRFPCSAGILRTVRVPMELAEPALLPLAIRTAGLRLALCRCPTIWLLTVASSDPKSYPRNNLFHPRSVHLCSIAGRVKTAQGGVGTIDRPLRQTEPG